MLNPDDRQIYTDALRPPPGFRFRDAVAATYSLDLETLLTIPLHLALFSAERPLEELLKDGVALLEALRRTAGRVTVYAQASRVLAPAHAHVLYGLLEPTVIEVMPPAPNGSFHPKLWLIRFDHADTDATRLRLLVLTRNITADRCWDLALTLEGEPGRQRRAENEQLGALLSRLPDLAVRPVPTARSQKTRELSDLALRTDWERPGEFERVVFHATGLPGVPTWRPDPSARLAVISPFVSDAALRALVESTREPVALVSRPEELAAVDTGLLEGFEHVKVLADQAELEDGEEVGPGEAGLPNYGLHAKAYVAKRGWDTHLYVGSANATGPALVHGTNVELVAELIGKRSRVDGLDELLGRDGFGSILMDYLPDPDAEPEDPEVERARELLERARRKMVAGGLRIRFAENDGEWGMQLVPERPLDLAGVGNLRAWLVTRKDSLAAPIDAIRDGRPAALPEAPLSLLTPFVAFELGSESTDETVRFVLSLEAENMPVAERDAAVVRDVIRNREGFLRYVMLLLAEAGEATNVFGAGVGSWESFWDSGRPEDDLPLFEHLTRAFCRDPDRLESIRRLLDDVGMESEDEVVPPEFLDLWKVFQRALHDAEEVEA